MAWLKFIWLEEGNPPTMIREPLRLIARHF